MLVESDGIKIKVSLYCRSRSRFSHFPLSFNYLHTKDCVDTMDFSQKHGSIIYLYNCHILMTLFCQFALSFSVRMSLFLVTSWVPPHSHRVGVLGLPEARPGTSIHKHNIYSSLPSLEASSGSFSHIHTIFLFLCCISPSQGLFSI